MNESSNKSHHFSLLLATTVQIKLHGEHLDLRCLMLAVQRRVNLCVSVPHKYWQMHSYILSHRFIKTVCLYNVFQLLEGHIQGVFLTHFNSKFIKMSHQM